MSQHLNATYSRQQVTDGFQVEFTASLSLIEQIITDSKRFLADQHLSQQTMHDIELGIHEALNNAICHGATNINQAMITYRLTCTEQRLITITVIDPGPGFDWSTAMGQPLPSLAESGRGLPILKKRFDTTGYNDRGNKLTLTKMIHQEER